MIQNSWNKCLVTVCRGCCVDPSTMPGCGLLSVSVQIHLGWLLPQTLDRLLLLPCLPWEGHLLSRGASLVTVAKPAVSLQSTVSTCSFPICFNRPDAEKLK